MAGVPTGETLLQFRNLLYMVVSLLQSGEEEIDLGKNPKPLVFVIHTFLSAKVRLKSVSYDDVKQKKQTCRSCTGSSFCMKQVLMLVFRSSS